MAPPLLQVARPGHGNEDVAEEEEQQAEAADAGTAGQRGAEGDAAAQEARRLLVLQVLQLTAALERVQGGPALLDPGKQEVYRMVAAALRFILRRVALFMPGNHVDPMDILQALKRMEHCCTADFDSGCSSCGTQQDIAMLQKVRPVVHA